VKDELVQAALKMLQQMVDGGIGVPYLFFSVCAYLWAECPIHTK